MFKSLQSKCWPAFQRKHTTTLTRCSAPTYKWWGDSSEATHCLYMQKSSQKCSLSLQTNWLQMPTVKNLSHCKRRSVFYRLCSLKADCLIQRVGGIHHMTAKLRLYFVPKIYNCIGYELPSVTHNQHCMLTYSQVPVKTGTYKWQFRHIIVT